MSTISVGASAEITRAHLERLAVVYVRQSTLAQVRDHGEATQRQYALTGDAERLGWPAAQVLVIDADLGMSGRGRVSAHRVQGPRRAGVLRRGRCGLRP